MTSRLSTEETPAASTQRRPRARRAVKKRGILPSFGDIVLPIVSIAAVALLILAGRQFFINGIKSDPGITSTRAYADSPALQAERERINEVVAQKAKPVSQEVALSKDESIVLAEVVPEVMPPVVAEITPAPAPATPAPAKTAPKPAPVPMNKQWRVQVGAYTSRTLAQEAAKKINRAGYRAIVYQNPASKHFKVWVEGGPTKFYADKIAEAMKTLGYKGSFSFPPAK